MQPGESAQNYWEGYPDGSRERYVTQLLADPADALVVNVTRSRRPRALHQSRRAACAFCACSSAIRRRPTIRIPTIRCPRERRCPHMQQGAQPPIFADANARWPVLLFSHGLVGSPISSDYIAALTSAGELRLCRRRAVSRRSALHRRQDRESLRLSLCVAALRHVRRNAGAAAAVAVALARLPVRAPAISRSSGRQPRRRIRRQPGRRVAAADDRRQADDHRRHVVQAGDRRPAAQGDRRLRAVSRTAVFARVRPRSERTRWHQRRHFSP